MTKTETDKRDLWMKQVAPLYKHLQSLGARMSWEGYVTLNLDVPDQRDIIIQHWCVGKNYYIVQIWADGSGWNVLQPLSASLSITETLEAIV